MDTKSLLSSFAYYIIILLYCKQKAKKGFAIFVKIRFWVYIIIKNQTLWENTKFPKKRHDSTKKYEKQVKNAENKAKIANNVLRNWE